MYETQYSGRFWPCVESWVSTKTPTAEGLIPSPPEKQRALVYGVQSMEGQNQQCQSQLFAMWHELRAEAAITKLSKDDIRVTNEKDKITNLKVVASLDQEIKAHWQAKPAALFAAVMQSGCSQAKEDAL